MFKNQIVMSVQAIKMSSKEFQEYCNTGDRVLSDMDYGYSRETKDFTVPSIEWESAYGTHWERFRSEEKRQEALDSYQNSMNIWVINFRMKNEKNCKKKISERKRVKNLNTLGGNFPQLRNLKF